MRVGDRVVVSSTSTHFYGKRGTVEREGAHYVVVRMDDPDYPEQQRMAFGIHELKVEEGA